MLLSEINRMRMQKAATHPDFEPFVINEVEIHACEIKVENFVMVPKV